MKSRNLVSFVSMLGVVAAAGYASPARAASTEYVSIILDQTGSMLTGAGPVVNGVPSSTRWAESIKAAKSAISANSKATTIGYGIWTFKQNANQNGPVQLWPLTAADCPTAANFETIVSSTGPSSFFCKINGALQFPTLTAKLDAIGVDPAQIPQDDWLTPLADSLCTVMESISSSGLTAKKTFVFESDAGENVSSMTCLGIADTRAPAAYTYLTTATDEWGMDIDSWQAKVTRKLYRFNQGLTNGAVTKGGAQVRLPSTDKAAVDAALAAYNVAWDVDIHYELFPPAAMMAMAFAPAAANTLEPQVITDKSLTTLLQAPSTSLRFSSQTAAAPLAAGAGTPSINLGELSFFKALGHATPRSKFREMVTDPNAVYGVTHKLPGDVDDSGCTDQADLNIVKQQDVWLQRAVQPLQIAIRADVTRDGWVDQADKNLIVAHWAQGCINPVRPPVL